jgi:hypothetical protein
MEAIIIPSTRQKIWDTSYSAGPTQARDAYTGSAFARWRAFAEDSGFPWFILSTKYGFLTPDQPIANYSVTISEAESDPAFVALLREQVKVNGLDRYRRVSVVDWERFQALVRRALGQAATEVDLHKILY